MTEQLAEVYQRDREGKPIRYRTKCGGTCRCNYVVPYIAGIADAVNEIPCPGCDQCKLAALEHKEPKE